MKTDDLIDAMARAPAVRPMSDRTFVMVLLACVAVPVAIFLGVAGVRPGAPFAWVQPWAASKTALCLAGFALLLPQVPRMARPEGAGEVRWAGLAVLAVVVLGLFAAGFATQPAATRFAELGVEEVAECLGFIVLISVVPAGAVLWLLSRGAVTRPGLAGLAGGLAAALGAASGYSLFCTRDNPVFFLLWYPMAIGIVALATALIARRMLRW